VWIAARAMTYSISRPADVHVDWNMLASAPLTGTMGRMGMYLRATT
jgi:hypothetical protein